MDKFFKLKERGTSVSTEITAGLTTFFSMAYIIFVNPSILAATGMSATGVFVATILSTIIGTVLIALMANIPYAIAPGMGLNAFFAYTVCLQLGFVWQEALAMVFICGIAGILITVTRLRSAIIVAVPPVLRNAIGAGIGLFIAYIGLKNGGLLQFVGTSDGFTTGSNAIPGLVNFTEIGAVVTLIGLAVTAILMLLKVRAALLIGIGATTIVALFTGVAHIPEGALVNFSAIGDIKFVAFSFFGSPGFGSLFADPNRVFIAIIAILAFLLTDVFDTIGTFLGTGMKTGIFTEEDIKKMNSGNGFSTPLEKGLFADCTATAAGALLGTSNVTTYVESASGIGAGGKTGLASIVTAIAFALCLPFSALIGIVPAQATAPILIIVGILMMSNVTKINWAEFEEAFPAFMTLLVMPMAYSITNGIAAGAISFCIAKVCTGKAKEVHIIMYIVSAFFILNFVLGAIGN